MKKKLLLLTPPVLMLVACRHEGLPAGVLTGEQMVDFLTDAYQLEGFYAVETRYRYDVLTERTLEQYDSILTVHGLSREQVERSFDYYSRHLDAYGTIHDSVVARAHQDMARDAQTSTCQPYDGLSDEMAGALASLPEIQRSILQLRDVDGYSYKEIARMLDISDQQVQVYLFRARTAMRKKLSKTEP